MRTTYTVDDNHGTEVPETPIRLLIKVFPDLAEFVFDKCITKLEAKGRDLTTPKSSLLWSSGSKIEMDYEFIDDAFCFELEEKDGGTGCTGKHLSQKLSSPFLSVSMYV